MPLFPSDFKKFKYVSSDEKTTTLQHPKGHEFKIAHSALSPAMKKQLLAMGGAIKADEEAQKCAEGGIMATIRRSPLAGSQANETQKQRDRETPSAASVKKEKSPETDVRTPEQKAKAKQVSEENGYYAEGGEVSSGMPQDEEQEPQVQLDPGLERTRQIYQEMTMGAPGSFAQSKGLPLVNPNKGFDPQTWQAARQQQTTEQANNAAQIAQAQQQIISDNAARADAGLPPLPVPNAPEGPQQSVIPQGVPQPTPQGISPVEGGNTGLGSNLSPTGGLSTDLSNMLQSGYQKGQQAIGMQSQATQDLASQQASILEADYTVKQGLQQQFQEASDTLNMERQALIQDIQEGHINPDKFWTGDPKTGAGGQSRIMAAIGMIVAGFNPTNSPNAAINYLKQQMEANLDAQKSNLSSKQSLLSMNMQQFRNVQDAMNMTRVMQADVIKNQLETAAAKAQSPMAKAAALQAASELDRTYAPLFQEVANKKALAGLQAGLGNDPSKANQLISAMEMAGQTEKAKDLRTRLVPGVGFANDSKDAEYLKAVQDRRNNIQKNAKEVVDLVRKVGTVEYTGAEATNIDNKLDQIATDMAKLQDPNSVARPNEVELVRKTLMNTGLFTRNKTAEKELKNFFDSVESRAAEAFKVRGMTPPKASSLDEGRTIRGADGKNYIRKGNFMVPVK